MKKREIRSGACPKCGGVLEYPGDIQQEGDGYYQDCWCPSCEFEGAECYYSEFTHFCEDTKDERRAVIHEAEPRRIMVTVEGGVIQAISNVPPGVVVEVHDYDTDEGRPSKKHGLFKNKQGDIYQQSEWRAEGEGKRS